MDLTLRNLFCCQYQFLRIQMAVIAASPIPGTYTLSVQRTPNQTDSDVTCSRSCDQVKITNKG